MNKKEEILKLYFEEHKTQEQIAKEVSVTQSYVSQVVQGDPRLKKKKEDSLKNQNKRKKPIIKITGNIIKERNPMICKNMSS